MTSRAAPAVAAVRLGYLATLPFLAGAIATRVADAPDRAFCARTLCAYAAVVIAFIGAIHWGVAFREALPAARTFVWGVLPSIVAWIAMLLPVRAGLAIEVAMLVTCYVVDRARYPRLGIAVWLPLRLRLTAIAALCCCAAAVRV